jgi:hypothetical protein
MMHKYEMFGEWRGRGIWGTTLADAVARAGSLQCPDKYADGRKVADGQHYTIVRVVGDRDVSSSKRGGHTYESVIVELDSGAVVEVDAHRVDSVA